MLLPFYVMTLYGGLRSVQALWPVLLVAGGSFAAAQFVSSNYLNYALTDVLSSLTALIVTLLFLQVWKPAADPAFAIERQGPRRAAAERRSRRWQGWLPWIVVSVVVILWTHFRIFNIGRQAIPWPGLHNEIAITLYNDKPYAAIWVFQPLATGTAILVAAIITAALVGVGPARFVTRHRRDLEAEPDRDPDRRADRRRWPT